MGRAYRRIRDDLFAHERGRIAEILLDPVFNNSDEGRDVKRDIDLVVDQLFGGFLRQDEFLCIQLEEQVFDSIENIGIRIHPSQSFN